MSPHQQVEQTCDTIFALTENTILENLCFRVIISSAINPKLKRPLLGLPKETYQNWNQRKTGDYIKPGELPQVVIM